VGAAGVRLRVLQHAALPIEQVILLASSKLDDRSSCTALMSHHFKHNTCPQCNCPILQRAQKGSSR